MIDPHVRYGEIQKHSLTIDALTDEYLSYLKALDESTDVKDVFLIVMHLRKLLAMVMLRICTVSGCGANEAEEGVLAFGEDVMNEIKAHINSIRSHKPN